MLAEDPLEFYKGGGLRRSDPDSSPAPIRPPYEFTNRGLHLSILTWIDPHRGFDKNLVLNCERILSCEKITIVWSATRLLSLIPGTASIIYHGFAEL